jgi:spermidine/putrescine transport system ATP-binding protein/putrescine transport system ATP-binding protein
MAPGAPCISIRNVSKAFGTFRAVDDVSFDIADGEFFSLLGASGSGKTTLLRMLAGFEPVSSGEIVIDGQPMADVPPYLRRVNMVFQNYALFPHLNVRDNIAYGLRKAQLTRARRAEMVEEMLELTRLPGFGGRRVQELSGGQRQRIALARALILRPKVLLLDEPLGALDKQLREQMQIELRRLQRTVRITFVFVTHDQEEALTLSDRVAVMDKGRVLQIDTPEGVYDAPASRRVAGFIGTMNFFEARAAGGEGGRVRLELAGLGTAEIAEDRLPPRRDGRLWAAIRPEKLALASAPPGPGETAAAGAVEAVAYLGERSHVHVRLAGVERAVAVSTQNAAAGRRAAPVEGRPVWVRWSPDAVIVLPDD